LFSPFARFRSLWRLVCTLSLGPAPRSCTSSNSTAGAARARSRTAWAAHEPFCLLRLWSGRGPLRGNGRYYRGPESAAKRRGALRWVAGSGNDQHICLGGNRLRVCDVSFPTVTWNGLSPGCSIKHALIGFRRPLTQRDVIGGVLATPPRLTKCAPHKMAGNGGRTSQGPFRYVLFAEGKKN